MRYGQAVIFNNAKYKYLRSNRDGSCELVPWGSTNEQDCVISAPVSQVHEYMREGRTDQLKSRRING